MRTAMWAATAALLIAPLAACGSGGSSGSGSTGMKEIRIAVRGSEDDPALAKRWGAYRKVLDEATGLPVKLYESTDYNGVIQAMSSGQVDMAMMAGNGFANVHAQVGELVAPILSIRQPEGELGYYSAIMVKADSPYRKLADLKGHSLGYIDFNSTSGYLFPRAKLREQGVNPDTFFSKTTFAGGHTQATMALENGQFDATIVNVSGGDPEHGFTTGPHFTMARRGVLNADDFRLIWTAGPIPAAAVVTRTDRPQAFIDTVRGAMASVAYDDPEMWREIGQSDGAAYTAVNTGHYNDVIRLRDADVAQRRGGRS